MCKTAKKLVETWIDDPDAMALTSEHETNYFAMKFDCDSVLDPKTIVYTWYQFAKYYDYSTGISSNRFAGKFIVLYTLFIITFLEVSGKYYIKYRNKLIIYTYMIIVLAFIRSCGVNSFPTRKLNFYFFIYTYHFNFDFIITNYFNVFYYINKKIRFNHTRKMFSNEFINLFRKSPPKYYIHIF